MCGPSTADRFPIRPLLVLGAVLCRVHHFPPNKTYGTCHPMPPYANLMQPETALCTTRVSSMPRLHLDPLSCSAQIRKAYKKSALKFHPDKAITAAKYAASLTPAGLRLLAAADVEGRLRQEANGLFNMISAAQEALTDPAQRRRIDNALDVESASFQRAASAYGGSRHYSGFGGGFASRAAGGFHRPQTGGYQGRQQQQQQQYRPPPRRERNWWDDADDSEDSDEC